ncbi:hypothetical protein T4E_8139, partial [Trichinella pseudospiralis]
LTGFYRQPTIAYEPLTVRKVDPAWVVTAPFIRCSIRRSPHMTGASTFVRKRRAAADKARQNLSPWAVRLKGAGSTKCWIYVIRLRTKGF